MRSTFRLLASVKPGRFLEPGNPTGLTGLFNHPAPRSTLIYLYSATLDKLKALPETSVYRQSAEALTQRRLKIVEAVKPEGYDAWAERARQKIAEHPEVFNTPEGGVDHEGGRHIKTVRDGRSFVSSRLQDEPDERVEEWDGEEVGAPELEGTRTREERADQKVLGMKRPGSDEKTVIWEGEPPLEASQISEIETQIGAGLIEEVIQVAEGELKLADTMLRHKMGGARGETSGGPMVLFFARPVYAEDSEATDVA